MKKLFNFFKKQTYFFLLSAVTTLIVSSATAQMRNNVDSVMIRALYDEVLQSEEMDVNLRYLTAHIGARMTGSEQAKQAVDWLKATMSGYRPDSIYLQPVMVPHWVRGERETASFTTGGSTVKLDLLALGGSIGTSGTLTAQVVEVKSWTELSSLSDEQVRGRIVFFNRAMNAREAETFKAYLAAADQRAQGAIAASKKGAIAALIRSLTLAKDDYPHTGAMSYDTAVKKIPAAALSTNSADKLSAALKKDTALKVSLRISSRQLPDVLSYNIIAELKGASHPEEFITVGAHIDTWDVGEGASDDGTGLVQAMEVLRAFKAIGLKPARTLRVILYMNEEAGAHGGVKYAEQASARNEYHVAAMESDAGGFTPRGFRIEASPEVTAKFREWALLLAPYKAGDIQPQQRGVDLIPMRGMTKALLSLDCDDSRLFYIHHTALDTYDKINPREVAMGAGAMAAMAALLCKYGL
ncbi:M20/M25/M40 family metallo-hydrolase [Chitinophaga ginsengisoli]|uniref:Carboxypeptidase Q n=1 Tax=Chitinophaga ginsengisoli TaxID=363837 RepID=A0A2P8GE58_9BACT|nr:M20/M25/M40 family metallo-hydrolase [Chitinophaga ginsengisoli]PSL32263.1 peptidase M28-like protein [Chitinophaga ginsengisoli]